MGLWKRKIPFALVLVLALLALVPVLAILQYRWLGQVSQAERERMQGNLNQATQNFRQDFDREVSRAFFFFETDAVLAPEAVIPHFASRLAEWRAKQGASKLIKDVYWVDATRGSAMQLQKIDAEKGSALTVEWLPELKEWRDRTIKISGSANPRLNTFQVFLGGDVVHRIDARSQEVVVSKPPATQKPANDEKSAPVVRLVRKADDILATSTPRILESLPALVIPLTGRPQDAGRSQSSSKDSESGYIIAVLDLSFLREQLIPALVARHFKSNASLDYLVLVTNREDKSKVIYRSTPVATTEAFASSDASTGIFAVRPEEFGNIFFERLKVLGRDGPVPPDGDRVTMKVVTRSTAGHLPRSLNRVVAELDGYWEVLLKHRSGSLEAAVGSVRRRSIGISLGVLGLLSASIVMLLISTRRSQKLAEQQMDFVAGVSHELRTPLSVIRSAAENLADGYIANPDHIRRYGALIRDEGRRLTDMVEQVLEVAGVQSGRRSYQLATVDPAEVIDLAISSSGLLISESGFKVDVQSSLTSTVIQADTVALSRAIQNLISNAIKYSGDDRRAVIRCGTLKADRGDEVCIQVEDFGMGIAAEDLPYIFEPFYRGKSVVAAQIHGSGLGLSLVKHIVESHHGRITVASSVGRGTVFSIFLPVIDENRSIEPVVDGYEQTHPAR